MLENFIRLYLLLTEIAVDVVRTFLKRKYQHDDFETFIKNNKSTIYHLNDNSKSGCCTHACDKVTRQKVIHQPQFDMLLVSNGQTCKNLANKCHCKFIANSNTRLVDIDLTLGCTLLTNCYELSLQEGQSVISIRTIRNQIAHLSDIAIDDATFNTMWGQVNNAAVYIALCISPAYSQDIQERIIQLKKRALSPVNYTSLLNDIVRNSRFDELILQELKSMNLQLSTHENKMDRMELRIMTALNNQWSNPDNSGTNIRNDRSTENPDDTGMAIGNQQSTENPDDTGMAIGNQQSTENPGDTGMAIGNQQSTEIPYDTGMATEIPYDTGMATENHQSTENPDDCCMAIGNQRSTENSDDTGMNIGNKWSSDSPEWNTENLNDNTGMAIGNQRSTENHFYTGTVIKKPRSNRSHDYIDISTLEETQCKTVDQSNNVSSLDEDDAKYFKLFGEVQQLRQNGDEDRKGGMLYSVLVYIVLQGSSTEEEIDLDILTSIYNSMYKIAMPSETVLRKTCFMELVPKYLDKVDDKFTPCNINIVKAVLHSYGNECSQNFAQNCSLDILLDYAVPIGTLIEDFHVTVDPCVIASVMVKRMQCKSDFRSVGAYINKLTIAYKNVETANLFIDTLEQSDEHYTSDSIVYLLDGLTREGTEFSVFKELGKLYNLFCRQLDEFGNTLFHYLVTRFSESKRFNAYIKFFCESNIVVMQIENDDNYTPIDFAAYQGRYDVIANVLGNIDSTEDIITRILTMVKDGVDSLKRINLSKSEIDSKLNISLDKTIILGNRQDFSNILDIIGIQENERDANDEEEENTTYEEKKAERQSNSSDDISKTVEKGFLSLATEIKKGLNAVTKSVPNVIKTIHQATKPEDDD